MRRVLVLVSVASLALLATAPTASANTTTAISATFSEPAQVDFRSGCTVFPDGFCGTGQVIPFGRATETIVFGAGCGGSCDRRIISLTGGTILLEETSSAGCDASCHTYPVEQVFASLADTVVGGTGLFEGATGRLTGTVMGAVSNARPAGASTVQLSGTIHYDP